MRTISLSMFAALPFLFLAGQASADPQMLGVIQTASAVPLHCSGGTCSAELSSICLHEKRPTPISGYPYSPHNPDALQVTAMHMDGTEVQLDPTAILKFVASRGFTTVRVSVPAAVIAEAGLASLAVQVKQPLTLIPTGKTDTRGTPFTEGDIELGAGPMRATAVQIVDDNTDTMHASEVLARMIDVLPHSGRAKTDLRAEVWKTAAVPHSTSMSETGQHRARSTYNRCYRQTRIGDKTLRGCLAEAHDDFVRELNVKYWDAVKAGS